jgi:hypothetical protein
MSMKRFLLASAAFLLVTAAHATGIGTSNCPPPRSAGSDCPQVVVWAKNPVTHVCCYYPTPCAAPEGWQTYFSLEACEDPT